MGEEEAEKEKEWVGRKGTEGDRRRGERKGREEKEGKKRRGEGPIFNSC